MKDDFPNAKGMEKVVQEFLTIMAKAAEWGNFFWSFWWALRNILTSLRILNFQTRLTSLLNLIFFF